MGTQNLRAPLVALTGRFPAFWLIINSNGNVMQIWLAIVIPFGIFYASIYGPEAALFAELFPTRVRYTGISFVYQFSGIFASGLTPIIATALLKQSDGSPWTICMYILFAGMISALSVAWIGPRQQSVEVAAPAGPRA